MANKITEKINTRKDLARVLKIDLAQLELITKEKRKHYRKRKDIKNGKEREYTVADKELKAIHQSIDWSILDKIDFPSEIKGGIKGRSRADNATPHLKAVNLAHFDIKNFYPSTGPKKVYISFISIGIGKEAAKLLTQLTTTDYLPVGFVTSPKISGLVLIKLNRRVKSFLKPYGIAHTLWIDDLTLSGKYPIRKLHPKIKAIIKSEGYDLNKIKSDKSKIVYKRQYQKVAGIGVNSDLSAERPKVDLVEKAIYVSEKFGIEKYIQANEPELSVDSLRKKMSGRIGNLISINRKKYEPLQKRWEKIIKKLPKQVKT